MSDRIRGSDKFVTILVDNVKQRGSMTKIMDISVKLRGEIKESDFLGEDETDLDTQYHGWDLDWTTHQADPNLSDLADKLVELNRTHQRPPDVKIQVLYKYRNPGLKNRMVTYYGVKLLPESEDTRGRKEYVENKFQAKAKRRLAVEI